MRGKLSPTFPDEIDMIRAVVRGMVGNAHRRKREPLAPVSSHRVAGRGQRPTALAIAASLGLLLSACATTSSPVPADYVGPVVWLADTGAHESGSKAKLFAAVEIDGKPINNALRQSSQASYGQGFSLSTVLTVRRVPVRSMRVKLVGTHQSAAPILEIASRMAGNFLQVEGLVDFQPEAGKRYEVVGQLTESESCVWIIEAPDAAADSAATKPAEFGLGTLLSPKFGDNRVTEKVCHSKR